MHSPFPGMDPFLERSWSNFHGSFSAYAIGALNPSMPPGFVAEVETDIYIHELSAEAREIGRRRKIAEGDAAIYVTNVDGDRGEGESGQVVAKPTAVGILPGVVEERVRRVAIRTVEGAELVTVIELLSPTNKIRHRDAYLVKRAALLDSPAHLVEIDLLRAGRRLPVDDEPDSDFFVTVSVAERRPTVDLFAFSLHDRMPTLPIPLRDGDFVPLDLRLVTDRVFEASAYHPRIYARPPEPPLSPEDSVWAADLLENAGIPLPPQFPTAE
ncbi:DUF4058 family protein [Alienimonas chondri]|uniref:DUF4058 family protein n=1 Tax=Alienimonas chondri TaxID=2681879 RepID=A0ABX1V7V2_9PLAN|nr:DUF4058 family protein [Alienimonas chondri]NNJ24022.1 hypothetical protein [Alienimonas chondri]